MKLLFELSKEHPTLPKQEILSVAKLLQKKYSILFEHKEILLLDIETDNSQIIDDFAARLSLCYNIDEYLDCCPLDEKNIKEMAKSHSIKEQGSICIRTLNTTPKDSTPYIHILAEIYTKNHPVDLSNPDIEVRLILIDQQAFLSIKRQQINRTSYEDRKAQHRPFFSPISLHPRIARTLINLSEATTKDHLLDPFCGTGGILIEAGLLNIPLIGSDLQEEMIAGCRQNLEHYKIADYQLIQSDIGNLKEHLTTNINAIVTDLPYGKSTTTQGENIEELYKRSFQHFQKILPKDGRAVIGLSEQDHIRLAEPYLCLQAVYSLRVHRSLTRYFCVFTNK